LLCIYEVLSAGDIWINELIMNTSLSLQAHPDPVSALWLGMLFAVYAAIGIPANLLVLILTVTKKSLRSVPLNMCIFSLSCTDLLMLVSLLSSTVWAFTFDESVCKIGGVSVYIAAITSTTMPSCLAVCRCAIVCRDQNLGSLLRVLRKRKGILALIGMYWTYGLLFPLPLVINDNFGLDPLGCCGITAIDSLNLWVIRLVKGTLKRKIICLLLTKKILLITKNCFGSAGGNKSGCWRVTVGRRFMTERLHP
jgi:hypothetical protein